MNDRGRTTLGGLALALTMTITPACNARTTTIGARDAGGSADGSAADAAVDAGADTGADAAMLIDHDAGVGDAGTDAGRDAGHDAGIDAGRDAGIDAGRDAGTDAGRDAGTDAGAAMDTGMCTPPTNDTCSSAIDITGGGTFMGTTCCADDTLQLGTGPPGCSSPVSTSPTPDVFFQIHTLPTGSNYRLVPSPGFAIQFVPSICSGNGGCGPYPPTNDFTISGGGGTTWYFAIERQDGTCGQFQLTVTGS